MGLLDQLDLRDLLVKEDSKEKGDHRVKEELLVLLDQLENQAKLDLLGLLVQQDQVALQDQLEREEREVQLAQLDLLDQQVKLINYTFL